MSEPTSTREDVETVAAPQPTALEREFEEWFVRTFHGVPLPTELFNRFRASADEFKARLRGKE